MKYAPPFIVCTVLLFLSAIQPVRAATYYVSTTGNDSNPGTATQPYATFSYANSQLAAGDTLLVYGGTYNQQMSITRSGTAESHITISAVAGQYPIIDVNYTKNPTVHIIGDYIDISGFTVKNGQYICELLQGDYLTSRKMTITGCMSHGTQVSGTNVLVETHTVYNTNLENEDRTGSSGWGSALKVAEGANTVTIRNNISYNNYGEGIAVTKGANVTVSDNFVYDNYSVQIYIDNSHDVIVERNLATCTGNENFYRNNNRGSSILFGMESYPNWGDQFYNVTVRNNFLAYCNHGIMYWDSEVPTGGLDHVLIYNNTLWGSTGTALTLNDAGEHTNTIIANNIIQQPSGQLAYVPSPAGLTFHHNLWSTSLSNGHNAIGAGDVTGDPKLSVPPTYNDKETFKISSLSPAINAGATISDVLQDAYTYSRPYGTAYDIGVHEYRPETAYLPTSLKNMYITFGYIKYGKSYPSWRLRYGDTLYLVRYNPSTMRIISIFLYDYVKKGNQGYTAYNIKSTSRYLRTNYLLPRGRQYAYVVRLQDIPTGIITTKYFVFRTY